MKIVQILLTIIIILVFYSCSSKEENKEYFANIEDRREITDDWMENDPNSPFNFKGEIDFHGLNYFEVDPNFVFETKFIEYDNKDTVSILGTKGEDRTAVRIGYLPLKINEKELKLNVYENSVNNGSKYYSIWFTDKTTNYQTYGVGRYLSFEFNSDMDHIYKIDFNLAYNPYCAYNSNYSCAIPTKEDYLDISIEAGEKKYHD